MLNQRVWKPIATWLLFSAAYLGTEQLWGYQGLESGTVLPAPQGSYPQPGVTDQPNDPGYRLQATTLELASDSSGGKSLNLSSGSLNAGLDQVVVVVDGRPLSTPEVERLLASPKTAIFVTDFSELVPDEVIGPETILVYDSPREYSQLVESGKAGGTKYKAVLDCVYADGSTKLDGLWKITQIRVNGVSVEDLKAVVDGNTILFSRKHTKSELHVFQLPPGQYQIDLEAEAIFEGKFFKRGSGAGTLIVDGKDAYAKVVFGQSR